MNFNIGSIFPALAKPPVHIRTKRAMSIKIDGVIRHIEAGEEVTIEHDVCRQLDADDYEMLTKAPLLDVEDPTPQRPASAPLPDGWEKIPSCFGEFHGITEEFRTAREHVRLIEAKRRELFGVNVRIGDAEGPLIAMSSPNPLPRHGGNLHVDTRIINLSDPSTRKLDRFLAIAEDKARDYLKRLIESKELPMQRAFFACGNHRLDVAEKLQELLDELAEIGLAIFTARVAALGLAPSKVRQLFFGSDAFVKFADHAPAWKGGTCFGGPDENGVMRIYCDDSIGETAAHALRETERLEALKPLLSEARKELAKAQKA